MNSARQTTDGVPKPRINATSISYRLGAVLIVVIAGWGGATFAQSDRRGKLRRMETVARPATEAARLSTVSVRGSAGVICQGVVVRTGGWIVTKASELSPGLEVHLHDGRSFPIAEVQDLGVDDLALIRIEAKGLTVAPWAAPEALLEVKAVGSLLVNIAASGATRLGVVSHATRRVSREAGFLGVQLADFLGRGVRVKSVVEGSAAERAGFKAGDLVVEFDGTRIRSRESLSAAIRRSGSGARVSAAVRRDSERVETELVLGERESALSEDLRLWGPISRRRSGFSSVIQHDAKIRPEDCGGPVVDLAGRVVALNLARVDRVSSYAVPSDRVRQHVDRALRQ